MAKYERERLVKGSLDVWKRRKEAYERRQAGEPYAVIARDLGISKGQVAYLAGVWQRALELWQSGHYHPNFNDRYSRLIAAGLLGNGKSSPEYGYA